MKNKIINKCKCGSTSFIIDEAIAHSAEVSEDGEITTIGSLKSSEIKGIICEKCGKIYKIENFKQINF